MLGRFGTHCFVGIVIMAQYCDIGNLCCCDMFLYLDICLNVHRQVDNCVNISMPHCYPPELLFTQPFLKTVSMCMGLAWTSSVYGLWTGWGTMKVVVVLATTSLISIQTVIYNDTNPV